MIKLILTAFLVMGAALPAFAQNDLALCKLRGQHVVTSGVAYQPGVDVYGNAVVPADVGSAPSMVPDVVRIPLNFDLAQRLGVVPTGAKLDADMGYVDIHRDGRVTFNGQDMTKATAIACGDQGSESVGATIEATAQPTKIIVPPDAPTLPMVTTPATVTRPTLPAHTLGQLTIPAKQIEPAKLEPANGSKSNEDLAKDDEIIWGEGN